MPIASDNDGLTQAIIRAAKIDHLEISNLDYSPGPAELEKIHVEFFVTKDFLSMLGEELSNDREKNVELNFESTKEDKDRVGRDIANALNEFLNNEDR